MLCSSNVGCEAPRRFRVFRGAACLFLPRCLFRSWLHSFTGERLQNGKFHTCLVHAQL
jgi:hypothetical protein